MNSRLVPLLALLTVSATGHADSIDDLCRGTMRSFGIPGMVLLVKENGQTRLCRTYGLADVELRSPVRRDTVFEIGSVSKQFAAAAVLLLAEDGKLTLDDPVGKHAPDAPEKWHPLTLRQLLSHTAGLKDTMQALDDPKFRAEDYFKKLGPLALDFEPGTSWSYSNMGYNLAAHVVEKVSGEKLPDFMQKRIFSPLKMQHTRFSDPDQIVRGRARGYAGTPKGPRNVSATYPATAIGAGSILSTVDDLAKWDQALMTGKFLRPASRAAFFAPTALRDGTTVPYALGWSIAQDRGRPIVEHGGNTMGFSCNNFTLPGKRVSIIALTNTSGLPGKVITRMVAARLYPDYDLARRSAIPDPDPKPMADFLAATRRFGRGNYSDLSAFSPAMRGTLSSIRGALTRLSFGQIGKAVRTYHLLDAETLPDGRKLMRYRLRMGTLRDMRSTYAELVVDRNGKTDGFEVVYSE